MNESKPWKYIHANVCTERLERFDRAWQGKHKNRTQAIEHALDLYVEEAEKQ